jgi:predicted amidohydrolase
MTMLQENVRIRGAGIFDTATGEIVKRDLEIRNGLVVPLDSLTKPKIVDASGLIVMFGLWDCHAHPGSLMYDPTG